MENENKSVQVIKKRVDSILKNLSSGVDSEGIPFCVLALAMLKAISKDKLSTDIWKLNILTSLDSENLIDVIHDSIDFINKEEPKTIEIFKGISFNKWKEKLPNLKKAILDINDINRNDPNLLGDIYECMLKFTGSGEFYTPKEVCEFMAKIALFYKPKPESIYDPTCGTGGLLIHTFNAASNKPKVYGQEININPLRVSLSNAYINEIDDYSILQGDTLRDPKHKGLKFDIIVANPPFSVPWIPVNDERFEGYDLAPKSKADMAFLLHSLHHLDEEGIFVAHVFPGILYRGGREQKIRQKMVENNLVECVISLPEGMFLNASINVSIVIFKKNKKNTNVRFINAEKLFDVKNTSIDTQQDFENSIFQILRNQEDVKLVSRSVPIEEIKENEYNLSVLRYVDVAEREPPNYKEILTINKEETERRARIIEKLIYTDLMFNRSSKEFFETNEPYELPDMIIKICNQAKEDYKVDDYMALMNKKTREWKAKREEDEKNEGGSSRQVQNIVNKLIG